MLKRFLLMSTTGALLSGLLMAPAAWAHWTHSGTLASSATSVDILQYTCAATYVVSGVTYNLVSFQARVRDKLPVAASFIKVQVQRVSPALLGTLQTDPNSNSVVGDGDASGTASPFSVVSTTAGDTRVYRINISKTATGAENYELDFHCLYNNPNNGNAHPTPTAPTYIQNQ